MQRRSPFIMNKVLILVIDGCAPEYITPEFAPNIHRLAKQYGFVKTVKAVVPTVTNVNHASILSGKFPSETGMVGNYYYNPITGEEGYIEEKGFMKASAGLPEAESEDCFSDGKGKTAGRVRACGGYRHQCADAGCGATEKIWVVRAAGSQQPEKFRVDRERCVGSD